MSTIRQRVRDDVVARLAGLPHAVGDPLTSFTKPAADAKLPIAAVWITAEPVESSYKDGRGSGVVMRTISLTVIVVGVPVTSPTQSAIEVVEDMAAEVELRMKSEFEGERYMLTATTFEDNQAGERPHLSAGLEYTYEYTTPDGDPSTFAS